MTIEESIVHRVPRQNLQCTSVMFMEQIELDKRSLLICHHSAQFAVPTQHPILARFLCDGRVVC